MGMDRTHDAGSGDGGARLASWGWYIPLRVSRWADRATDDDAGQPHRDIDRTAIDDAADGDVDAAARADAQADGHAHTDLRSGQRHVPAGDSHEHCDEVPDDRTATDGAALRHAAGRHPAGTMLGVM